MTPGPPPELIEKWKKAIMDALDEREAERGKGAESDSE